MSQLQGRPTADVSVRVAWADDAADIARLQVMTWREAYAQTLPAQVLQTLQVEDFESAWRQSINRPKQARQRVLVALERATIRGFAAIAPATDSDAHPGIDAEITEFVVDLRYRRLGHGSRLLHAVVDTLRSDKFARATVWLNVTNDDLRGFLAEQGWAVDGAHRELDLYGDGSVIVKQVRLHTDIGG